MKTTLKILFVTFLVWMLIGGVLLNTNHPKAQFVMGSGVFFMAFILMPLFIYYRYKGGKYKKYIIKNSKEKEVD